MKTAKHFLILMILTLSAITICNSQANAKSITKTIESNKTVTIKTRKVIKKITDKQIKSNEIVGWDFDKTGTKKFKIKVVGNKARELGYIVLKIQYTDKTSDVYTIYTTNKYKKEVCKEIKRLMKNPNHGIKTMISEFHQKSLRNFSPSTYVECCIGYNNGRGQFIYDENAMLNTLTTSQKKAVLLELYARNRMQYSYDTNKNALFNNKNGTYKNILSGTYKGVCGESAMVLHGICHELNIQSKIADCEDMNHAWLCIAATDSDGSRYWQGVRGTSFAYNMKWGADLSNVNSKNTKQFYKIKQSGIEVKTVDEIR